MIHERSKTNDGPITVALVVTDSVSVICIGL
jgi:hypothetical protein